MTASTLKIDFMLTEAEEAELVDLAKLDADAAKIAAKYSPGQVPESRAGARRAQMLSDKETAAIDIRMAELYGQSKAERTRARDYPALRAHVAKLVKVQHDIVVSKQVDLLLCLSKGEDIDMPALLLSVSPIGLFALLAGGEALIDKLVAPARPSDTSRPLDFDVSYRLLHVQAELDQLRARREELNPDPDALTEAELDLYPRGLRR